jgi:hypothetical protein
MVLNLSPLAAHLNESLTSLRFTTKVYHHYHYLVLVCCSLTLMNRSIIPLSGPPKRVVSRARPQHIDSREEQEYTPQTNRVKGLEVGGLREARSRCGSIVTFWTLFIYRCCCCFLSVSLALSRACACRQVIPCHVVHSL